MGNALSKVMLDTLASFLDITIPVRINQTTVNALVKRGLLNQDHSLTHEGTIIATERLSLLKQCSFISIPYNTLQCDSITNPELQAYNLFALQGYVGSYCEGGGFGTVIKALCLDELTKASIFYGTYINPREDACLKGVVVLSQIEKQKLENIYQQILQISKVHFLTNFSEIISYSAIREWYPGLTLEFAEALFDVVPKEHFIKLAKWISLDHSYRNGWPYLTLVKDGKLKFVEVKTTDKLHRSQLITIPALIKEIKADVSVLQLSLLKQI